MQCAAENRICWRYHRPSIHYYQTINYTESNLINLIGSSWIIFCKRSESVFYSSNIYINWTKLIAYCDKPHIYYTRTVCNIVEVTYKKVILDSILTRTIWSAWKMDNLILPYKLHVHMLSYPIKKPFHACNFTLATKSN